MDHGIENHEALRAELQARETADTLSALKHAESLGQLRTLAVCNVAMSAMMRMTRLRFLTRAGVEIGVA